MDNDHFGLDKAKRRILEYLAVRQLKNSLRGPILCFVGPPGNLLLLIISTGLSQNECLSVNHILRGGENQHRKVDRQNIGKRVSQVIFIQIYYNFTIVHLSFGKHVSKTIRPRQEIAEYEISSSRSEA